MYNDKSICHSCDDTLYISRVINEFIHSREIIHNCDFEYFNFNLLKKSVYVSDFLYVSSK